MPEELSIVGKSLVRKDALEKVMGVAKCVADIQIPGMLQAKYLRCPYAHARITKIDTSRAKALPGVKCILTYKNVPRVHPVGKFEWLLSDVLDHAGEEVAAVAAETDEIAKQALELIDVEYEELHTMFDAEEAIKPGAPLLHPDYGSNAYYGTPHGWGGSPAPRWQKDGWLPLDVGDVEKGLAEADAVVENVYKSPTQCNCSPIPRSVVCQWDGNYLKCWADSQLPMNVVKDLSHCLGMPQSSIRVIMQHSVGGYGSKQPEKIATLTAIMAKRTDRAVKSVFAREEEFVATHRRPNYKGYERMGVKKDGTVTAMSHKMVVNFGRDFVWGPEVVSASAAATCGTLYMYQNMKFRACAAMTSIPDCGAMNGLGDPEAGFIVERLVDEAAEAIGMDPVEFRLKNCTRYGNRSCSRRDVLGLSYDELELRPGDVKWSIVGHDFDSLQECIKQVRDKAGWKKKWKGWGTPVAVNGAKRTGIGTALGMHMSAFRPYSAIVKMNQDGSANVMSSAAEIGQGIRTAMSQVVAETLGIHYEDVDILLGDTAATPEGFGVIASGGTSSGITAAWHAAQDAKRQLFDIAAARLGAKPEELAAKDRKIYVVRDPERAISVAEACLHGYQVTGIANNPSSDSIVDEETGKVINSYAGVATIAEVEVDTETGGLTVLRLTSAHDCGKAINPTMVENQIHLGVTQAIGYAIAEEFIIDESTGVVINPDLLDYKVMTILDVPKSDDFKGIYIEYPSAWGAYGTKGFSETGATSGAPAIVNAVYNAIGVRVRGEKVTPAAILEALAK